jgi:hypothetical protein
MQAGGIGNCWYTVYVGARYLVDEDYDATADPRVAAAEAQDLEWCTIPPRSTADDQDVDESKRILLFGKRLALIGDGGDDAAHLPAEELFPMIEETRRRLLRAGIKQQPKLWAHCDVDLGD